MLVQKGVVYIKLMYKWPEKDTDIPPSHMWCIIFFCMPLQSESGVQWGTKSWGSSFQRKQVIIAAFTADTLLSEN
jgi:hypothetical protein